MDIARFAVWDKSCCIILISENATDNWDALYIYSGNIHTYLKEVSPGWTAFQFHLELMWDQPNLLFEKQNVNQYWCICGKRKNWYIISLPKKNISYQNKVHCSNGLTHLNQVPAGLRAGQSHLELIPKDFHLFYWKIKMQFETRTVALFSKRNTH